MGNEVSQPKEEGVHVEYQQRFFEEYQRQTLADLEIAVRDTARWDSAEGIILDMPIDEQAQYCDYVTTKICELDSEIVKSSGKSLLFQMKWLIEHKKKMGVCAVANFAKTIISQTDADLKKELSELFDELLVLQRKIRDEPDIRQQVDNLDPSRPENFGNQLNKIMTGMMKDLNQQMEQGRGAEEISRDFLTRLGGEAIADEVILKVRITEFLQRKLNEGSSLEAAIRATKAEMHIPPGTEVEVKIKVRFDDDDEDDQSAEDAKDE